MCFAIGRIIRYLKGIALLPVIIIWQVSSATHHTTLAHTSPTCQCHNNSPTKHTFDAIRIA